MPLGAPWPTLIGACLPQQWAMVKNNGCFLPRNVRLSYAPDAQKDIVQFALKPRADPAMAL
ncbi:hypothetical protein GCM10027343_36690 [Noviherbaspirillum agri]